MARQGQSVLIVDDDDVFRTRLARALAERGLEPIEVRRGDAAVEQATAVAPDLAVVDLRMPGMSGLEVVRHLKKIDPRINILVLTGYGSIATALDAVRLGATHYLTKPADADDILRAFDRADRCADGAVSPAEVPQAPSLARAEWEHINRVLADCGGNISKAARVLGVHRRSLQRKLAKYPTSR